MTVLQERQCLHCGAALIQRENERPSKFRWREACDKSCAAKARGGVTPTAAATRLMSKVVEDASGCWQWTGATVRNGYGVMGRGARGTGNVLVHRLSYEVYVGPIPEGLHIDHLCRNRACINPSHLEAVTQAENNRRAASYRKQVTA